MKIYASAGPILVLLIMTSTPSFAQNAITKYVLYSYEGKESFGILNNETIEELEGDLFSSFIKTGNRMPLSKVKLLAPCNPSKVLAVGLNYRSHLGDRPVPVPMGLFAKYPTSIIAHEEAIQMPPDASNLHYEGELVIVIGKKGSRIALSEASEYIFGVTAGNDVSERDWQRSDLQWFRADMKFNIALRIFQPYMY